MEYGSSNINMGGSAVARMLVRMASSLCKLIKRYCYVVDHPSWALVVIMVYLIEFDINHSGGTNGVCECEMDMKVYMDSYMAAHGSCFLATWTIFKNHFLEVGLTRIWETTALRTFTTVDSFYYIMCEDLHEQHFIEWHLVELPGCT